MTCQKSAFEPIPNITTASIAVAFYNGMWSFDGCTPFQLVLWEFLQLFSKPQILKNERKIHRIKFNPIFKTVFRVGLAILKISENLILKKFIFEKSSILTQDLF